MPDIQVDIFTIVVNTTENDDIQSDEPAAKKPTRSVKARFAAWNCGETSKFFTFFRSDKSSLPHHRVGGEWHTPGFCVQEGIVVVVLRTLCREPN